MWDVPKCEDFEDLLSIFLNAPTNASKNMDSYAIESMLVSTYIHRYADFSKKFSFLKTKRAITSIDMYILHRSENMYWDLGRKSS